MMMSSMTSNEVMLRSIHQIKDHSLTIPWYGGGGKGENGGGGRSYGFKGEGNGRREVKSTLAKHKERIDCQ